MSAVSILVCSIIIVIEAVFVPLYLKKMWPTKNKISLCCKMICATGYLTVALTAISQLSPAGSYSLLMLTAFVFSWLGDLFLHIPKPLKRFFLIGMIFFMGSHLFFCWSYIDVQQQLFANRAIFTLGEIVITAAIVVIFFGAAHIKGVRFELVIIPGLVYAFLVTMMMIKSTHLGIIMLNINPAKYLIPAILLFIGGGCFVMSDATLALIMFDTRFKKFKLKVFNIITYFVAQLCLAMTVFFVN